MSRRTCVVAVAAALMGVVLTGCTMPPSTPVTSVPAPPSSPSASAAPPAVTPAPDGPIEDAHDVPSGDELTQTKTAAVTIAVEAMRRYARPEMPAAAWLADLSQLLSPRAAASYAGTNPAAVPAHTVTGDGVAGEDPWDTIGTVLVPTDAGDYVLLLARTDATQPWRVELITPPKDTP